LTEMTAPSETSVIHTYSADAPVATKLCCCCRRRLPCTREYFRTRGLATGGWSSNCHACHRTAEYERNRRKRAAKAFGFAAKVNKAEDSRAVRRLAAEAFSVFHGARGFQAAWHAAVAGARPGGRASTSLLLATLKIAAAAQPERIDVARRTELLSDEELQQRIRDIEQQMLETARAEVANAPKSGRNGTNCLQKEVEG
jgi:hypothetical protein